MTAKALTRDPVTASSLLDMVAEGRNSGSRICWIPDQKNLGTKPGTQLT